MKILVATPLYPPDSGGPAIEAQQINKWLPRFGIDVEVYSFGTVRHLPAGIRHLTYAYKLFKRAKDVDGIVAIDTFSVCVPAAIVAKLRGKKFIVRVPGDFVWEQAVQRFGITDDFETFQTKRYGWRIELLRAFQQSAVRSADLVVHISDYMQRVLRGWNPNSMRIYLGSDISSNVKPQGKREHILFSAGRFVPWKGFRILLKLIETMPPEWRLVVAGDGPDRKDLEQRASKRVTFTGSIPHAQILDWLSRADVFVLNTSWESFSFQILEAMQAGIPVITTNVAAIPEIITDGKEGILCTPNDIDAFRDAVLSTHTDPEIWERRTRAAQEKARTFSAETSMREFADATKKICE